MNQSTKYFTVGQLNGHESQDVIIVKSVYS